MVDAAMNDLVRPAMYDAYHGSCRWSATRAAALKADVVGPICEVGRLLCEGPHPPDSREGELVAFMSAGAYGYMASRYNTRPAAAEVLVRQRFQWSTRARLSMLCWRGKIPASSVLRPLLPCRAAPSFSVIGAGRGARMAAHLVRRGQQTTLVARRRTRRVIGRNARTANTCPRSAYGTLAVTSDLRAALAEAEVALIACPSQTLRAWCERIRAALPSPRACSCSSAW